MKKAFFQIKIQVYYISIEMRDTWRMRHPVEKLAILLTAWLFLLPFASLFVQDDIAVFVITNGSKTSNHTVCLGSWRKKKKSWRKNDRVLKARKNVSFFRSKKKVTWLKSFIAKEKKTRSERYKLKIEKGRQQGRMSEHRYLIAFVRLLDLTTPQGLTSFTAKHSFYFTFSFFLFSLSSF